MNTKNTIITTWTIARRVADYVVHFVVEPEDDGFIASCRELPGVYSQGGNWVETLKNIEEAFSLVIESYKANGKAIPWRT